MIGRGLPIGSMKISTIPPQASPSSSAIIESGEKAALATVIGATGSTPGKESAKMLIRADGSSVGSIGGGLHRSRCLGAGP